MPATVLSGVGGALFELIGNRPDHRERPLDHLVEHVIRPLVIVLRELADDPGETLFALDPDGVGFEVAPNRRLTGRVVVTGVDELDRRSASGALGRSVRRFGGYLDEVARAFHRAGLGAVDGAVARVLAAELRFLPAGTAGLLGPVLAQFVHTVDAAQDRVLRSVLRAVAELARLRRADPALPAPLVAVNAALAGSPGLDRFARDVCDAGGELVVDPATGRGTVVARFTPHGHAIQMAGGPRIGTFETLPRQRAPAGARAVPALSHTRSLEELQLAELRTHRPAREYVVLMSAQQSLGLVRRLVAQADLAALRTAQAAAAAQDDAGGDRATVALIRHVLTRKQFIKGSRGNYPIGQAEADMLESVRRSRPIPCVMMGFPLKQCENGLKALGRLPDLAELGALVRLRELGSAVRNVYPPGIRLTVLTDGRHFRPRSAAVIEPYQRKLAEYARVAGCEDFLRFVDVDEHAAATLGIDPPDRQRLVEHHRGLLQAAFAGLDITGDPLLTLHRAGLIYPRLEGSPRGRSVFPELFTSIAYSAPVAAPQGADRMAWSKVVYDELYDLGPLVPSEVVAARRAVLRHTWDATVRYAATLRADAELGYDRLFDGSVWLKAGAPRAGTCGFCFLGGSGLLPWHGSGAVGPRGEVSTDFAVSLVDQAFVPVYSPLLGGSQPFLMAPVTATYVTGGERGARLAAAFVDTIRLRRR